MIWLELLWEIKTAERSSVYRFIDLPGASTPLTMIYCYRTEIISDYAGNGSWLSYLLTGCNVWDLMALFLNLSVVKGVPKAQFQTQYCLHSPAIIHHMWQNSTNSFLCWWYGSCIIAANVLLFLVAIAATFPRAQRAFCVLNHKEEKVYDSF